MRRATRLLFSAALLAIAGASPAYAQEVPAPPSGEVEEASEAQLSARIRAAYDLLEAGKVDEGFSTLREALAAAARTDNHGFTIRSYTEAASQYHAYGLNEQAAQLFGEGAQTRAAQADIRELAYFYLAYAQFRTVVIDPAQHFVPLFAKATDLFDRHFGRQSRELIDATDKLAEALSSASSMPTLISLMLTSSVRGCLKLRWPSLQRSYCSFGRKLGDPGLPEIVTAAGIVVLFAAAAGLAGRAGKRKERHLFEETGGRPYNPELSHLDMTLDTDEKIATGSFWLAGSAAPLPRPPKRLQIPTRRAPSTTGEHLRLVCRRCIAYATFWNSAIVRNSNRTSGWLVAT